MEKHLSWTTATFTNRAGKRQQVWALVDANGALALDDGRASIRYADADDAKVYAAHPRNVELADGSAPRAAAQAPAPTVGAVDDKVWQNPAGERITRRGPHESVEREPGPAAGTIEAWTDGACTGNPGPCGYGVILRHAETHVEITQYIGTGTNNIAELYAIGVALESSHAVDGRLLIHTDSTYAIGVLSKGWKAKANVELIAWIRGLMSRRTVEFIKVRGHDGIPLNERADQLAVEAVERRR